MPSPSAPPNRALAKTEPRAVDLDVPVSRVTSAVEKGGIEMVKAEIGIPIHHQYKIAAGREQVNGEWRDKYRVGVTADGYDYINRFVGAQFFVPEFIHNEKGEQVRNPIHRRDFIYERMVAIWYNDLGQMQAYSEDLEVDYQVLYQQTRLNSTWYVGTQGNEKDVIFTSGGGKTSGRQRMTALSNVRIKRAPDGVAILDDLGNPSFDVILPDEMEARCLQRLYDLRATGLRYAQTVLKNRLMKVITGVRMLPINEPRPFKITVMAYRDALTPEKRMDKVYADQESVFGKTLQRGATLSDEEIAGLEIEADADVAPEAIAAARNVTPSDEDELDRVADNLQVGDTED